MITPLAALLALLAAPCGAPRTPASPAPGTPQHYVFFSRDHDALRDTAFLDDPGFAGAQLTYTWRELEPARDAYAFDSLRTHAALLARHGKRLFVQLQDVSFSDRVLVPAYLLADTAFHGGAARKSESDGTRARFDGWVARRWDPAVRERFARLLQALAREFDGVIEGVVLPETAVSFDDTTAVPGGYTPRTYAEGIRANLAAARGAFTRSCVILYANFMPGDSLRARPGGTLHAVHAYAAEIGAGVGGPDILPFRRFQQMNSLPLIAARPVGVVAGMAVQDGNLAERDPATGRAVTAEALAAYATETLRLDYIFWGRQEPYFSSEVRPFVRSSAQRGRRRPEGGAAPPS